MIKMTPASLAVITALMLSGCLGGSDDDDKKPNGSTPTSNGKAFQAAVETPSIAFLTAGVPVYWDMETNSLVTEHDDWELKFMRGTGYGWTVQVNGGASGSGQAAVAGSDGTDPKGVGALQVASVWDVTDPTNTAQVYKYFADGADGAFSGPGDYGALHYAVGGDNHDMWPTFTTYLIEDNGIHYKVQVISNRGASGTSTSGTLRIRIADAQEDAAVTTVTLDASANPPAPAHLNLDTGGTVSASGNWQLAYEKYVGFKLNNGVKACIAHEYTALYNGNGDPVKSAFQALNTDNTLSSFNAVDLNDPDICTPVADTVKPLIPTTGWYYGYAGPGTTANMHTDGKNGWIIRSADGQSYARIRFASFVPMEMKATLEVERWQ